MAARILVVDDEPNLAALLASLFDDEGYETQTARDGQAAIAAHHHQPADLILSDVRLPRLSGPAMIQVLRDAGDHTPVILMSSVDDLRERPTAVPFLHKPFDVDQMLAQVRQLLVRQRAATSSPIM